MSRLRVQESAQVSVLGFISLNIRSTTLMISALLAVSLWSGCRSDAPSARSQDTRSDVAAEPLKRAALVGARDPAKKLEIFRFFKYLMGTKFTIQLLGYDQLTAQAAARAAFNEVARVEHLVSSWRADSEIGVLNRAAGIESVSLSLESAWLLCQSRSISRLTRGAFDVTWAALKGLWDFRNARMPEHKLLQKRLRSVGMKHLTLELTSEVDQAEQPLDACRSLYTSRLPPFWSRFTSDPPALWSQKWKGYLKLKTARVDLGGIAKGFGVDQAARVLRRLGYQDFLIDGGGDLLASGRTLGGDPWSVGIAHPRAKATWGRLWIPSGWSVVTSGDYERYFIRDQVRYHHIIDLRTGYPGRGSVSVTVIARSAMLADAYATGLFILGPREGLALAESLPDLEAIFFTPTGEVISTEGARVFSHDLKTRWSQ